jgi:hypothetical protein
MSGRIASICRGSVRAVVRSSSSQEKPLQPSVVFSRRALLGAGFGVVLGGLSSRSALAESSSIVPIGLQVQLIAKVAAYDRNFAARAGTSVVTLIVKNDRDPESTASADHARHAFGGIDRIVGLAHSEEVLAYVGASALASSCTAKRAAIIYVMPGLSNEIDAIRSALSSLNVLTACAIPSDLPKGIVLAVDQLSGKPKLLVNLPQAQKQRVDFSGDLLRMATVIR